MALARQTALKRGNRATTMTEDNAVHPAVEHLPLPLVSDQHMDAVNLLSRRRGLISFSVVDRKFTLGSTSLKDAACDVSLVLTTRFGPAQLHIPGALLDVWLERHELAATPESLPSAHQALLLEAILDQELSWLEQQLDSAIEFTEVRHATDKQEDPFVHIVSATSDCGAVAILAIGSDELAQKLAVLFDQAADPASLLATSVPVSIRIFYGSVTITFGELKGLERDDVILLADNDYHSTRCCCLIGDKLVAPVSAVDGGWKMSDRFLPLTESEWDFDMATERRMDTGDDENVAGLADIPVTLVFEAGRVALPLADVQRLDTGALIPLGVPSDNRVAIFASGKRVGQGELVKLGEKLGIRVLNIFDND